MASKGISFDSEWAVWSGIVVGQIQRQNYAWCDAYGCVPHIDGKALVVWERSDEWWKEEHIQI